MILILYININACYELTPYHYKLVSITLFLLVPDKFVSEISPKCTIKKFSRRIFGRKHIHVVRQNTMFR